MDTFIAEVSIDSHRSILVYLREHGGRQYVRWRVFHRHRRHGNWYPDKHRSFVVPLAGADGLAGAIAAAGSKQAVTSKPAWLQAIDAYREHRYRCMTDLNAPPRVLDRERRKMLRAGA